MKTPRLLIAWLLLATQASAVDINGQLKKADLENQSSDPSSPAEGRIYLNTTSHKAKYRSNSAWLTILDTVSSLTAANITGQVAVANGGTGIASGTSGGVLAFTGAGTVASSGALTANGVVLGGGAGAVPSATAAGSADQTLVIPHAGGAPAFGQLDVSQAAAVKNQLAIANGGTGQSSAPAAFDALSPMTTLGDIIYGGTSGANTRLAGNSTSTKKFLRQTGTGTVSAAPAWDTLVAGDVPSLDASKITSGQLAVAQGGTGLASGTSGGILGYTASGTLASSGALTANQLVLGGGAGATPSSLAAGSQYQVLTMGASNPGYGAVNLAQSAAITGTLPVGNGGTGVTSVTTSPTATAFAGWDANKNLSANSHLDAFTTTATAAGTTTLTVSSTRQQVFTGTTTQTVALPVASTLAQGQSFKIINQSSGVVTVQSSGGNTVQAMAASSYAEFFCVLTSGTTAASWAVNYSVNNAGGGTVTSVAATVPGILTISGSPITTSGTLALSLATQSANTVFAGPSSGGAVAPTFRALVAADLPASTAGGGAGSYTPGAQVGYTGGSAIAAGNVGEKITWASAPADASINSSTIADWTNASIPLTAGIWLVQANISVSCTANTTIGNSTAATFQITDSGNSIVQNMDKTYQGQSVSTASTQTTQGSLSFSFVVNVSSSTTYKIRYKFTGAGGNCNVYNSANQHSEFFGVRFH